MRAALVASGNSCYPRCSQGAAGPPDWQSQNGKQRYGGVWTCLYAVRIPHAY
jgi:hypothetical protein